MMDELLKRLKDAKESADALSKPIEEGDEDKYLMLGENQYLPASARISLADQKRNRQMMENSTIGSFGGKKNDIAEGAFKKLREAVLNGYKPSAAEMVAASKYQGKPIVVPTAEDVKRVIDSSEVSLRRFEDLKKVLGK